MSTDDRVEAKALYYAFKQKTEAQYLRRMQISGVATKVGPDVYMLPSVEVSEEKGVPGRALCVLPFNDYLKLRKVSKGDCVVMEGDIRGFADKYDIVVVKDCRILEVNGQGV